MIRYDYILIFLVTYLIGSVSGSIMVSKTFFKEDIRTKGSGNAGTTNVYRTYGLKYAILALAVDLLKGFIAPIIANLMAKYIFKSDLEYGKYIAGVAVVIGHIWPIYYQFKGGKGMATFIGLNLYFDPLIVVIQVGLAVILLFSFKIMSIASIVASIVAVVYVYFQNNQAWLIMTLINAILVIYSHRSNIDRLIKGEENKLGGIGK